MDAAAKQVAGLMGLDSIAEFDITWENMASIFFVAAN